MKKKMYGKN